MNKYQLLIGCQELYLLNLATNEIQRTGPSPRYLGENRLVLKRFLSKRKTAMLLDTAELLIFTGDDLVKDLFELSSALIVDLRGDCIFPPLIDLIKSAE